MSRGTLETVAKSLPLALMITERAQCRGVLKLLKEQLMSLRRRITHSVVTRPPLLLTAPANYDVTGLIYHTNTA